MRDELAGAMSAAQHQTIAITVSGLAELAHTEYQVRRLAPGVTPGTGLCTVPVPRPGTMRMRRSTACSCGDR
jgi:hypothetical protein